VSNLSIICGTCRRSWRLAVDFSIYVLLDLTSRPCPYCGADTLNCCDAGGTPSAARRSRPLRQARTEFKSRERDGQWQVDS
jgi:hypothetical protein